MYNYYDYELKIYDIFYLYKYSSFSVNFHPEIHLL